MKGKCPWQRKSSLDLEDGSEAETDKSGFRGLRTPAEKGHLNTEALVDFILDYTIEMRKPLKVLEDTIAAIEKRLDCKVKTLSTKVDSLKPVAA
jgi:hypothetical protein